MNQNSLFPSMGSTELTLSVFLTRSQIDTAAPTPKL